MKKIEGFARLLVPATNMVPATRISMQNTSTHWGTGPRSKSLRQAPATSPLVCAVPTLTETIFMKLVICKGTASLLTESLNASDLIHLSKFRNAVLFNQS